MEWHIIFVGLDVHKDTIAVSLAEGGLRSDAREHGKVVNTPQALKGLSANLGGDGFRPGHSTGNSQHPKAADRSD